MKELKLFIMLASLFVLAGCTEDDVFSTNENLKGQEITITVGMPEEDELSRVSYDPADNTTTCMKWETGDVLVLLGFATDGTYIGQQDFNLVGELAEPSLSASFKGCLVPGATQYRVCYKAEGLEKDESDPSQIKQTNGFPSINYADQTQSAINDYAHLKNYLLLHSGNDLIPETNLLTGIKLTMQNCIMRFNIQSMQTIKGSVGPIKSLRWETVGTDSSVQGTRTLAFGTSFAVSDNQLSAYMCFDPTDMNLVKDGLIRLVFTDDNNAEFVAQAQSGGKTYEIGHRYHVNINNNDAEGKFIKWVPLGPADNEIWVKTEGDEGFNTSSKFWNQSLVCDNTLNSSGYYVIKPKDPTVTAFTNIPQDMFSSWIDNPNVVGKDLIEVWLPKTITSVGSGAFFNCLKIQSFKGKNDIIRGGTKKEDGTVEGGKYLVCDINNTPTIMACALSGLTSFKIPEGITAVGNYVFAKCETLTSVPNLNNLTNIGDFAFYKTKISGSLDLTLTNLGQSAFEETQITSANITFSPNTEAERNKVRNSTFFQCGALTTVTLSNVKSIGDLAFGQCKELTSLTLSDNIVELVGCAFSECSKLPRVDLKTTQKIGNGAFQYCSTLESVTMNNVVNIGKELGGGDGAFINCTKLKEINIPQSAKLINDKAFYNCGTLKTVRFAEGSQLEKIGMMAFSSDIALEAITIPANVTEIEHSAFSGCKGLASVNFEDKSKLTILGNSAFSRCEKLPSITIPSGVKEIDNLIFYNCKKLQTVTFADNSPISRIGSSAFHNCELLSSISIPQEVTEIDESAFENCTNLATVVFSGSSKLTKIANSSFHGSGVKILNIPSSVTYIGKTAFYQCPSLERVNNNDDSQLTTIDSYAFKDCDALKSITLPPTLRTNNSGFALCDGVTDVIIKGPYNENNDYQRAIDSLLSSISSYREAKVTLHIDRTSWKSTITGNKWTIDGIGRSFKEIVNL